MFHNVSNGRVTDSVGKAIDWVLSGDKVYTPVSGEPTRMLIRGSIDGFDELYELIEPGLYRVNMPDDDSMSPDDVWVWFNPDDFMEEAA